jgi:sugar lactone lactonase YvrE
MQFIQRVPVFMGRLLQVFICCCTCTLAQAAFFEHQAIIGGPSPDPSKLSIPTGLTLDSANNLYVANANGNSIVIFNAGHQLVKTIGSFGTGNAQFNFATQVALGPTGKIYALDSGNHRVQRFDTLANGAAFEFAFSVGTPSGGLYGMTADSLGNIYVADTPNHRIQKFDANGTPLTTFGSLGSGNNQFNFPTGLTFDLNGNLLVADSFNQRIATYTTSGTYLSSFSTGPTANDRPKYIAVDPSGNIAVTFDNNMLAEFDSAGNRLFNFGTTGSAPGQFSGLQALAFDNSGNLYTTESFNNRVQLFTPIPEPSVVAIASLLLCAAPVICFRRRHST